LRISTIRRGVDLAQPIGFGPGPCGLGPKKPTGPKTLQKPCGPGPTHGLSSSTRKIYYFLKYITICGTGPTNRTSTTTRIGLTTRTCPTTSTRTTTRTGLMIQTGPTTRMGSTIQTGPNTGQTRQHGRARRPGQAR